MVLEHTDQAIAEVLRGAVPQAPLPPDAYHRARVHGVSALLAARLAELGADEAITPELRAARTAHELYERLHLQRLREVLDALALARIDHVLLKGTPVAHQYYEEPALRSRGDTDLLVNPDAFERAAGVFESLGYRRALDAGGRLQRAQASFERTDGVGCHHVFDVHHAISDRRIFAAAFDWSELHANTVPLRIVHATARTLTPPYLLLHAALHRVAHLHAPYRVDEVEHAGDRLVWLHDIALIARHLDEGAWQSIVTLAVEKALAQVLLEALETARRVFPFDLPARTRTVLAAVQGEASARLLRPSRSSALLEDVRTIEGWRAKLALLAELLFPPPAYMRARYDISNDLLLPWLYLRRAVRGGLAQLRN